MPPTRLRTTLVSCVRTLGRTLNRTRPQTSSQTMVLAIAMTIALPLSASAEEKRMVVLESPCPGPACDAELGVAYAQGHRVVYLNFEGVTLSRSNSNDDARTNQSGIVNSSSEYIAPFDPDDLRGTTLSRSQIIDRVVSDLYRLHQPYDIEFVTSRPGANVAAYSMVVFGGNCVDVAGQECAGIALRDCGDRLSSNITFVFPPGLGVGDLATTAAQEAAHAWGLGHTDDRGDIMFPRIIAERPSGYGAGNIMGADGNPDGSGCPSSVTYQDSHAKMLQNIGPRGQDSTPPTVEILEPSAGETIYNGTVVRVSATDNLTVAKVEMLLDGVSLKELTTVPWEFAIPLSTEHGEHSITIRATDISDLTGQTQINVFLNKDNVTACTNDDPCAAGTHCNGSVCVPDPEPEPDIFETCTDSGDCNSGVCVTVGAESLCSQQCSDNAGCPAGSECLDGAACWPSKDSGGICNAGGAGGGALALMMLAMLAVVRRRA